MCAKPTPWRTWLAAAAALGVPPFQFWRLSMAEWRALTAPHQGSFLSRADFQALTRDYPDKT